MLLSEVVGAVVSDLLTAQDAANEFASQLSLRNKLESGLRYRTLNNPQVVVGRLKTLELDLKFAFDASVDRNDPPTFGAAIALVQLYVEQAVKIAIAQLTEFMSENQHFAADPVHWHQVTNTLGSQQFLKALTQQTTESILQQCGHAMSNNWVWNADLVPGAVLKALEQQVLNPANFRPARGLETPAFKAFKANYQHVAHQIVTELAAMASTLSASGFPTASIAIGAEQLKQLRPQGIAAIKIKALLNA